MTVIELINAHPDQTVGIVMIVCVAWVFTTIMKN